MEREGFDLHAVLFELCENFGREVKACCRSGGATGLSREDGLIAIAVFRAVVAVDVRREWHVADFVEDSVEVRRGGKAKGAFAELACGEDFGFEEWLGFAGRVKEQTLARFNFTAGTN